MSDRDKIQIISAKKVSDFDLITGGDKERQRREAAECITVDSSQLDEETIEQRRQYIRDLYKNQKRCGVCCAVQGFGMSIPMTLILSAITTGCYIFFEKKITYTLNSAMKQIVWLSLPGIAVSLTLHMFLSEAMWSKNKNSWGQSWARAVGTNTVMWASMIGAGTFGWRFVLPRTTAGKRIYYKYICPADSLEIRQMRNPNAFFTGMNWVYFASGLLSGQVGFSAAAAMSVQQSKTHFFMSPTGSYAQACMPAYRIEAMLRNVNFIPDSIVTKVNTAPPPAQKGK